MDKFLKEVGMGERNVDSHNLLMCVSAMPLDCVMVKSVVPAADALSMTDNAAA